MNSKRFFIHIYNPKEDILSELKVEQIGENEYRATESDLFDCRLTFRTEFETEINERGLHKLVKITKASPFITRRFLLSIEYTNAEYELLGEELVKRGGFWQVDMGGIATINIPKDLDLNIDDIMKSLNLYLSEII